MEPRRIAVVGRAAAALLVSALALLFASPAHTQAGALYRCGLSEYTNMLSADEAAARRCAKIAKAEWVVASAGDAGGWTYEYNERRTVDKGNGTIETWLQVVTSAVDVGAAQDAGVVKTVSRHVIQCDRHTITSGATYLFDPRDNSVVRDSREQSPFFPPPGPVAEALIHRLCGGGRTR